MTDQSLMCVFTTELPEHAKELLWASSQLDDMHIS